MELDLSFINKTNILPVIILEGFGSLKAKDTNIECRDFDCRVDCRSDCISECGNCEEGDYGYNLNCYDCFDCNCDDCDYDDGGDY